MYNNLQAEMVRKGLDEENIAKVLGVTSNTVKRKLKGEIGITITEAKRIQTLFPEENFTIDFLFTEK